MNAGWSSLDDLPVLVTTMVIVMVRRDGGVLDQALHPVYAVVT